jgi:hypothetical protein
VAESAGVRVRGGPGDPKPGPPQSGYVEIGAISPHEQACTAGSRCTSGGAPWTMPGAQMPVNGLVLPAATGEPQN